MSAEAIAHYRRLLEEEAGIAEGLCWTVVQGVGSPLSMDDVITRIGGDPATLADRHWQMSANPSSIVYVGRAGSAVTLFEVNGHQGQRTEVMRRLSDRACVYSVSWHVNGGDALRYAAYGTLITYVDPFSPDRRGGCDPSALDDDLGELLTSHAEEGLDYREASMAVVEARTGVRLTMEWFQRPRPSVVIPQPLPDDPYPPSLFASIDPDLHVALSLADPQRQRAALARTVRLLADRFDLNDQPAVARAIAALAPGGRRSMPTRDLVDLQVRLSREFEAVRDDGPMEDNPVWRRMQAATAVGAAVTAPGPAADPLDTMVHARGALGPDWPSFRSDLRAQLRAGVRTPQPVAAAEQADVPDADDDSDRAERRTAEEERISAIRAWARSQGLAVTDDGPLPASVIHMYDAAH